MQRDRTITTYDGTGAAGDGCSQLLALLQFCGMLLQAARRDDDVFYPEVGGTNSSAVRAATTMRFEMRGGHMSRAPCISGAEPCRRDARRQEVPPIARKQGAGPITAVTGYESTTVAVPRDFNKSSYSLPVSGEP